MASNTQNISHKAGEVTGQAQIKKDEIADKASNAAQSARDTAHETKDQAGGILQQTGAKVQNMAQGAAEAVKNTLGMNQNTTSNNPTSKN